MDQAQLELLVRRAITGEVAENWVFYILMLCVVLVGGATIAFTAAYLQARAKTYATKADFDELLLQLKQTTTAAESVKAAILHDDWQLRERKLLKRQKLESLLMAVYECHDWLQRRRDWWFSTEDMSGQSPDHKVIVVAKLYFPELQKMKVFIAAFGTMNKSLVESKIKIAKAQEESNKAGTLVAYQAAMDAAQKEYARLYPLLLAATSALEDEAAALMSTVV